MQIGTELGGIPRIDGKQLPAYQPALETADGIEKIGGAAVGETRRIIEGGTVIDLGGIA